MAVGPTAVVDNQTNIVTAVIMADPDVDQSYPGTQLIAVPDDVQIWADGFTWDSVNGFVPIAMDN